MIAKLDQGVVVVPWDFSRLARAGLDHALRTTNTLKQIHVVHVATPLSGPDNGVLYAAAEREKCRELECRFREQVADNPALEAVNFHVIYGYRGVEIAKFADRYEAELIIVPSPEKRSILDILFGGLAKQVVNRARTPVLVVQVSETAANLNPQPHNILTRINRICGRHSSVANAE